MDPDGTVSDIGANYFSQDNFYSMDILEGWNMIGISVESENLFYQDIFENTIENSLFLFSEGGMYEPAENLQPGFGYWLRFEISYQANISGTIINSLTINITEGWNLISGISFSLDVEAIEDPNNLIIPGTFFKYDGNYTNSETIDPGFGYWVRSTGSGQIILNYTEE